MRLFVKDWVAQWDPLYNAWFYYHPGKGRVTKYKCGAKYSKKYICSDYSTWDKPEELAHMTLDSPGVETRTPVSHHNVIRHPSAEDKARGPPRARSKYRQNNLFQPHHNQQAKE